MKKLLMILPCLAVAFTSCSNDEVPVSDNNEQAILQVNTSVSGSRAMISDTSLPDKSSLGVTLVENKDDATNYDGLTAGYFNIEYKANGNKPAQTWTATNKPIYLSATNGKAVAYYPYNADENDYKSLTISASNQVDYMYSGWVKPISNSNPEATFEMQHAMTGIRVRLKKGTYTAAGVVKEIRLASSAFGTQGKLNAATGKITDVTVGEVNTYMMRPAFEEHTLVTDGYKSTLLMAVPVDNTNDNVTITVGVDGKQYQAEGIMDTPFLKGNIYTFELTLNNTALQVSNEVSVSPWLEDETSTSTGNGGVLSPL